MKFSDLCGDRIDLIKICEDGLADMHEYSKNPEFYKYFEYEPFKTIEETKKYLNKLIELSKSPTNHFWFIKYKKDKKIIGTFGVRNIDEKRNSAEIGYGISPNFWNKGFFSEALKMVLKYLFYELNFFRVYAITQHNNHPSIKSLENAGFTKEGILRKFYKSSDMKRHDAILLSILKEEFLNT